jgi:hypothetical protein
VSIDEVVRDAKARQEAIGTYQGEQRKLFEAQWARKAEENLQIQAELETVKARYTWSACGATWMVWRGSRPRSGIGRRRSNRKHRAWRKPWRFVYRRPGADASGGSMAEVSLIDTSAKPVQALRAGAQGLAKFCTFPKKASQPR